MTTVALILAAGKQTRWEMDQPPYHKQLLDVAGETVIARIVRQCRDRNVEPTIASNEYAVVDISTDWFKPGKSRWTVETLLSTCELLWQERTIILLGDVVYSRTVMDRIFAKQDQELKVFGSEYEIYALSMQFKRHSLKDGNSLLWTAPITDILNVAIRHAESGAPGGGKLRKFYQIYCGLDPDDDKMEGEVLDRVCYIQDYTRDVDTRRDYIELQNKVIKAGLLDDLETRK